MTSDNNRFNLVDWNKEAVFGMPIQELHYNQESDMGGSKSVRLDDVRFDWIKINKENTR